MSRIRPTPPPPRAAPDAGHRVSIGGERHLVVKTVGSGVPIVFLHGFPLDHTMWAGQRSLADASGLLAGEARLILPDLAGFGASDGPASASIAAMAEDVVGLLDGLGIAERVVVCGLSMGGYVAQHLAARHADRLAGLVLVDTKLEADTAEARAARADLSQAVGRVGTRIAAEAMVPRLLASGPDAAINDAPTGRRAVEEQLRRTIEATSVATIQTALAALADRPDLSAAAAGFTMPTLLVVGAEDAITPPECLERAAVAIAGSTLVVVPRCGHMTPLEDPVAFNEALGSFMRQRLLTAAR